MGGNALKYHGARRFAKEEYVSLSKEVLDKLEEALPGANFVEIPYYSQKEDFGDMDLLCLPLDPEDYELIHNVLDSEVSVRNSEVLSILYKGLQIDIIPKPEEEFMTSWFYYSFNDLGNLLGKIFHKFGLKYGHRGLTLPLRDGDHQFDEVLVSRSTGEIMEFIGLDPHRFWKGFKTLEEVYEFVESSPYCTPSIYALENLNSVDRIRDRKRSTYQGFLARMQGKPEKFVFEKDKSKYLEKIWEYFPEAEDRYEKALKQLAYRRECNAKFNGELVMEWTGLQGVELGHLMKKLKGRINPGILSKEEIEKMVMEIYEKRDY